MKNIKRVGLLNLSVCFLLITCAVSTINAQDQATEDKQSKFLKTENSILNKYIVVFDDENSALKNKDSREEISAFVEGITQYYGGKVERVYYSALKGFSVEMSADEVIALSKDARVKYVVEDGIARLSATQYNATWGLDRVDQQFRPLNGTYNYTATGAGVRAYVIDTGILPWHAEFGGRAFVGADFIGDGRNGIDCIGHGTHVSGTIAGNTVGIAKGAFVIGVRVFGCSNFTPISTIISGIDWVRANRVLPAVANLSLGGGANQALDDAVRNLIASGVTAVVAAGNDFGFDANNVSPARVREAITVGATDINDNRANFSNVGSAIDVFAPGVDITSSWFDGGYRTISGTSMATPHVAGAVATFLNASPGSNPTQAQNVINSFSTKGVVGNPGAGSPNALLFSGVYNSCGVLYPGQGLFKGQSVTACNGAVTLVFQYDGNVVLYKNFGPNAGRALWHTNTWTRPDAVYFVMQNDGNLVLYASTGAIWNSGTWGNPFAFLLVQNDSNVVIYSPTGRPLWHTGTYGL